MFTSAPILKLPNPDKPFLVEVNASEVGIGSVLSQHQGKPKNLYPCDFYSQELSPGECHFDIGNHRLLAIKAALEEWQHWLEGPQHPFALLTDHHILEYIQQAKGLNPRWALFFTHLNFSITFRPVSKNTKANALSRYYLAPEPVENPEAVLPGFVRS